MDEYLEMLQTIVDNPDDLSQLPNAIAGIQEYQTTQTTRATEDLDRITKLQESNRSLLSQIPIAGNEPPAPPEKDDLTFEDAQKELVKAMNTVGGENGMNKNLKMDLQTFATPQGTDMSIVLNQIRATASSAYQDSVPLATADNISDVGEAVLNAPQAIRNEYMQNLYNKIGLTLIDYPVVNNHLSFLKKGRLEYGQTIEDIYVGLATAEPYITGMSDGEYPDPFKIHKVPHRSAFYHAILSRQYPLTRHVSDLRKAFHGASGLEQFIGGMMNAITSREAFDDYRMTVALIARQLEEAATSDTHQGRVQLITLYNEMYPEETVDAATAFNNRSFLQFFSNQLKKWAKRMNYLREDLNIAGVPNILPKAQQRIMMPGDLLVDFDTQLLPWAYNNGNLEIGGVDEIDAWYSIGANAEGEEGVTVTPDDITVKSDTGTLNVVGLIYDPGMVKIYNKEHIGSTQENAAGNYWNLFTSVEDIYAASPYKNFVYFTLD